MEPNAQSTAKSAELPDPAPRFDGHSIQLGGKTYVMPSLSLRSAIDLQPQLQSIQDNGATMTTADWIGSVLDIVLPAFRRNYPTMSRDDLTDLVDLANIGELLRIAIGRAKQVDQPTQ